MALVDLADLHVVMKDSEGMLPQPSSPIFKTALVQIYVRAQPFGGSDKSSNGCRYDWIPFVNGMINAGCSCQVVHYVFEEHDQFFKAMEGFHALIVRCNPGQIKADGGSQERFDASMRALKARGIQVWPSPDVMEFMGAKDALTKIANMSIGLPDTLSYYDPDDFAAGFRQTMCFQPRVIKQNRGSSGEGIWIIKLKSGRYCSAYGDRSCTDDEVLCLMEANDNHAEEHTVGEFIEFCINGRTAKSGKWTSQGEGKYLEGGKAAGGMLVDQRFCPRIIEGELRYNMVGAELVGIIHKKPKEGGISAVGGTGSIYTFYGPDEPTFATLTANFNRDVHDVMPNLGLSEEPLPLWWTADFILASPAGTPAADEKWIVGEFNCSCVGISKCLAAFCKEDTPSASWADVSESDKAEAMVYGNKMGVVALSLLQDMVMDEELTAQAAPLSLKESGLVDARGALAAQQPAALFGGWFYKKLSRNELPGVGMVIGLAGKGWGKRYLRLFPGKLEWYKDESPAAMAKPKGYAPLGVFKLLNGKPSFDRICTTIQKTEDTAPPSHHRCLRVSFSEYGEAKYRLGMGAHHEEYIFSPENEAEVRKLENAVDDASAEVSNWQEEVIQAGVDAIAAGKSPINAALAKAVALSQ